MKLAIFDDLRLGAVVDEGIVDLTDALPWPHDPEGLTATWWRCLCRDFNDLRPDLEAVRDSGRPVVAFGEVQLRASVLNPSKIVAAASNYRAHVEEMHGVQQRTLGKVESWMMDFDVFLKAPSAITGPAEDILLPAAVLDAGDEIHHESELVVVVGAGGKDIPESAALDRVFGYTVGLDITVRSPGDRSRRKSYDSFSPLGPWVTTRDETGGPDDFDIELSCNGAVRQQVNTCDLLVSVPRIVSYASSVMTLLPGDVIFTGAPPGVGPIKPGDVLSTSISKIGAMTINVRRAN